jgi:hypothetical protein
VTDQEVKTWQTHAVYHHDHNAQRWYHDFGTRRRLRLLHSSSPGVAVKLIEDPEGPYYGWMPEGAEEPTLIRVGEYRFRAQFHHDPKEDEEAGLGRIVRLRIEEGT